MHLSLLPVISALLLAQPSDGTPDQVARMRGGMPSPRDNTPGAIPGPPRGTGRKRTGVSGGPGGLVPLLRGLAGDMPEQGPARDRVDTFVYVSMAPEQKIRTYRLDPGGQLTLVDDHAVAGAPDALTVDPAKAFLFASLRTDSTLASFRIDPHTGKLTLLSTARLPKGEDAAYVGTDRTGRWLLSASYAAGKVVVHRIRDDGTIQRPPVQTVATAKSAHCTVTDRDNHWLFVPHVAANAVYQFRLDPASGKLTAAGKAAGGADGAGPRHLAFHPTRDLAFSSDERGSSITVYEFDSTEGLLPSQTLSTLPAEFKGRNSAAEVKVHPSGKFVWVSNRGHDSLAGFEFDPNSGNLGPLGHTPTEKTPRSFDLTADGRFLLAAGEGSGRLAVYRIDPATGKLTPLQTYDVGRSLTWVLGVTFGDLKKDPPDPFAFSRQPFTDLEKYARMPPSFSPSLPELLERSRADKKPKYEFQGPGDNALVIWGVLMTVSFALAFAAGILGGRSNLS